MDLKNQRESTNYEVGSGVDWAHDMLYRAVQMLGKNAGADGLPYVPGKPRVRDWQPTPAGSWPDEATIRAKQEAGAKAEQLHHMAQETEAAAASTPSKPPAKLNAMVPPQTGLYATLMNMLK